MFSSEQCSVDRPSLLVHFASPPAASGAAVRADAKVQVAFYMVQSHQSCCCAASPPAVIQALLTVVDSLF